MYHIDKPAFVIFCFAVIQILQSYNMDTENVRLYRGRHNDTMFGFAVEFIKTVTDYQLYIGAPKEIVKMKETGDVYICDVTRNLCREYYREIKGKHYIDSRSYNNEMFGSTITQMADSILICAYKWTKKTLEQRLHWFITGRCLSSGTDFIDETPISEYFYTKYEPFFAMAQRGFSADSDKENFFVIGAPGLSNWRGGLVLYEENKESVFVSPNMPIYSYLGYSVVVGKFCHSQKKCIAAGAPHHAPEGMVFFLEYTNLTVIYTIKPYLIETQKFSFFGGSLGAADLNGDGFDDILISASFYSDLSGTIPTTDAGRVYVYSNTLSPEDKYFSENPKILKGSGASNARFGTSIANAGDLNSDGFEDVAIGAPYEEENRGVVYIYHGSVDGVNTEWSQRISGKSLSDNILSFGWYISKPADIDQNSYPDIAVGSYLSDTVVVLRSRPIADIIGNISTVPPVIYRNNSCIDPRLKSNKGCFVVHICFSFSGRHLPNILAVNYTMSLDDEKSPERKRVKAQTVKGQLYTVSNQINVTANTGSCQSYEAFTLPMQRDRDIFPLVQIVAEFDLVQPADPASEIQPIRNISRNHRIRNNTVFKTECGNDDSCDADLGLKMTVTMSNVEDYVIINKTRNVYLDFVLSNKGEDAFANVISLTWSGNSQYQKVDYDDAHPVTCSDEHDTVSDYKYECELVRPLFSDDVTKFRVTLDSQDISTNDHIIKLEAVAKTSSNEINVKDDRAVAEVKVWIVANIEITSAKQDDILLTESQLESRVLKLRHRYVVKNKGPSFLPTTSIYIDVPTLPSADSGEDTSQVKIKFEDGREEVCTAVDSEGQKGDVDNDVATTTTSQDTTPNFVHPPVNRRKRSTDNVAANIENSLNITCATFTCRKYKCHIFKMKPGENLELNTTIKIAAKNLPKDQDLVRFFTHLEVEEPKHELFFAWTNPAMKEVFTNVYIQRSSGSLNIWVIVGSIIGGLLLLFILLIVLWKLGFFKRAKKDEVQKWKRESDYSHRSRSNTQTSQKSNVSSSAPMSSTSETKPSLTEEGGSKKM